MSFISCGSHIGVILSHQGIFRAFLVAQMVKNLPANAEDVGLIPGSGDPLEKGMATHSSTLAWQIPRTEEPVRLLFMGLQRVGHD